MKEFSKLKMASIIRLRKKRLPKELKLPKNGKNKNEDNLKMMTTLKKKTSYLRQYLTLVVLFRVLIAGGRQRCEKRATRARTRAFE